MIAAVFPRPTTDPWGRQVLLTEERWEHIIDKHREMESWQTELLKVIPAPDVITPDRMRGRWHYWAAGTGVSRWLFVVVDWRHRPARIVTAFPKRRDPQWIKPSS
jgi:hypothetical protein